MKALPSRRVVLPFALLLTATVASAPACSTSNEVLAWEEPLEDGGGSIPIDSGGPTPQGAVCGNGIREEGEACEDGNVIDGDGCSAKCVVETAAPTQCPGTAIQLDASNPDKRTGHVSGDTSGRPRSFDSPTCGGGNGTDIVYAITSDVQGQARVRLDAAFDALLYVRTTCTNATSEVTCKTVPIGGGRTDISFPMAKGQTSYVVVDGVAGKSGKFDLDVEIGVTSCGDGLAQYPEQCDDGNTAAGDGCSPSCQLESPMSAAGKCPGASFTIVGNTSAPVTMSFAGNTALLKNTASSWSDGSGPDQVYAITPTTSGSLTAVLHASYPDAFVHVRGECFSSGTEIDVRAATAPDVPVRTTFPAVAGRTYFIFADATESDSVGGLYTLDVTLSPPACGNGQIEAPESCDDGNTTAGDGCSDTCTLEPMPAAVDTCPGAAITLAPGANGAMTFLTSGNTALLSSGVKMCRAQNDRKDAVYTFVAPFDGYATATAKATFDVSLDIRTNCLAESSSDNTGSAVVKCGTESDGLEPETVRAPVKAGTTYYIVVDGPYNNRNKEGAYTLSMDITPSVCGNGVLEGGEVCDDGGNAAGDGCAPDCKLEPDPATGMTCANPRPITFDESTPGHFTKTVLGGNWNLAASGNFLGTICASPGKEIYYSVTAPVTGTLVANITSTYNLIAGLRATCPHTGATALICTNRTKAAGTERLAYPVTAGTTYVLILDAQANQVGNFTMDLEVGPESCGDGVASANEECDDGNNDAGDGCSPTCTLETLAGVDTCPGYGVSLTGTTASEPRQKQITVGTANLAANYSAKCGSVGGGMGRDGVVAVTSDVAGTLVAQLTSSWPATLYSRSTCTDGTTELKCQNGDVTKPADTLREISFPVKPGIPVFVFVDALTSAAGAATLSLTVNP